VGKEVSADSTKTYRLLNLQGYDSDPDYNDYIVAQGGLVGSNNKKEFKVVANNYG
jgi:hypothetical protein